MREPDENIERRNRTVAKLEIILTWLDERLERANKLSAEGSPRLARQERVRQEGSSIQMMAEYYRDKFKTLAAEPGADQGRLEEAIAKLDKIVGQTEMLTGDIKGQSAAK